MGTLIVSLKLDLLLCIDLICVRWERQSEMMLLNFLLAGIWSVQVRAWYNISGLPDCQHHAQDWRDLAKHIENNEV